MVHGIGSFIWQFFDYYYLTGAFIWPAHEWSWWLGGMIGLALFIICLYGAETTQHISWSDKVVLVLISLFMSCVGGGIVTFGLPAIVLVALGLGLIWSLPLITYIHKLPSYLGNILKKLPSFTRRTPEDNLEKLRQKSEKQAGKLKNLQRIDAILQGRRHMLSARSKRLLNVRATFGEYSSAYQIATRSQEKTRTELEKIAQRLEVVKSAITAVTSKCDGMQNLITLAQLVRETKSDQTCPEYETAIAELREADGELDATFREVHAALAAEVVASDPEAGLDVAFAQLNEGIEPAAQTLARVRA